MGIYVKGVEMPTSCVLCRMSEYHVASPYCKITEAKILRNRDRNNDCPLVPVPEPHGRLIDETYLNMQIQTAKEIHENEKHDFCNAFDSNGHVCTEWWCVEDMIGNAPTIIPAMEGET